MYKNLLYRAVHDCSGHNQPTCFRCLCSILYCGPSSFSYSFTTAQLLVVVLAPATGARFFLAIGVDA